MAIILLVLLTCVMNTGPQITQNNNNNNVLSSLLVSLLTLKQTNKQSIFIVS